MARDPAWWRVDPGGLHHPLRESAEPFCAARVDGDGQVTGLLTYRIAHGWDSGLPDARLHVLDLITLDASAAPWRHCLSQGWVSRVNAPNLAPDDPLPLLLGNPRAARRAETDCDFLCLRPLDLPRTLSSRAYAGAGRLVLRVTDDAGYADGWFALETAEGGTGTCARVEPRRADLALDVSTLASPYLGHETAARLHAAGLIEEMTPGATHRADSVFRAPLGPWCPNGF